MILNLSKVSDYRSELMGLSIIFIMLFHCNNQAFAFGFVGVELFLSLSALGLFFSLKKDCNLIRFYKKRFIRIIPAYFAVSIPLLFYYFYKGDLTLIDCIKRFLQISSLRGGEPFLWFIAILGICYTITPFFLKYKKILLSYYTLTIISIFCFTIGYKLLPHIIIERIPIFLFSLKLSSYVYLGKKINLSGIQITFLSILVLLIFFLFVVEMYNHMSTKYDYLLGSIVAYPFLLLCVCAIPKLHISTTRSLRFLGAITLELYLVHEQICLPLIHHLHLEIHSLFIYLLSILFAIILAYALHKIIQKIQI